MPRLKRFSVLAVLLAVMSARGTLLAADDGVRITVTNPTDDAWPEAPVDVAWSGAMDALGPGPLAVMESDKTAHPVQCDDLNQDGRTDEIVFLLALAPRQTKTVELVRRRGYETVKPRAHAPVRRPG